MSSPTDEEIAFKVQQGDTEAFGILVERYEQKMLRYASKFLFGREDSEDVVQDVFLKAYANIQGFNTNRRFSPWLYRIAHNEFINTLHKHARLPVPFFDPDTLFPHPLSNESADRAIHEKELRAALDDSLGKLDEKYREPLVLYFFEDLSYQEIAEVMQIPISTVGVRISRGKQQLLQRSPDLQHTYGSQF
ncbi:MAG: RNA polymerase sigma factor [Patescibacteria group bacterium]|jgi:RNA polymerase sigma-70 factor (ECF subfamily)